MLQIRWGTQTTCQGRFTGKHSEQQGPRGCRCQLVTGRSWLEFPDPLGKNEIWTMTVDEGSHPPSFVDTGIMSCADLWTAGQSFRLSALYQLHTKTNHWVSGQLFGENIYGKKGRWLVAHLKALLGKIVSGALGKWRKKLTIKTKQQQQQF